MTIELARTIWLCIAGYLGIGAIFAIYFASRGVDRIDHAAKGANLWFRLFLAPGVAALWPMLLLKSLFPGKEKSR